jgi:hypothetical protein
LKPLQIYIYIYIYIQNVRIFLYQGNYSSYIDASQQYEL